MKKIRVLIVDDSLLIRKMFTEILNSDPDIEVIGTASDPLKAREKIKSLNPDVITLDIEMPNMDGLSFLEKIMALRPMPVVMASSLTQKGAEATIRALEIGAVDYIPKTGSTGFDEKTLKNALIEKVKIAARAKVRVLSKRTASDRVAIPPAKYKDGMLIAIGSSTGGVEALGEIITLLPKNSPPVIVTQHMPEKFTATFAKRLDGRSEVTVQEAQHNERIKSGNVYIAKGDKHLELIRKGGFLACSFSSAPLTSGHRPSVDVMFESVAKMKGIDIVGVILTGMGKDGAKGMLEMKKSGSYNIGQDESTSIVYGMPKAAYLAGAVDKQLPITQIATEILQKCS